MSASTGESTNQCLEVTPDTQTDVNAGYRIPEWFRKYNLLTKTDLEHEDNKLRIVDESTEVVHGISQSSNTSTSQSGFEISRKAYQDVHDLTASTLVPTGYVGDSNLPVLMLRSTDVDGGDILDGVVKRLAVDLDATYVSLALYDLEDLGRAFQKQVEDIKVLEEPMQSDELDGTGSVTDESSGKCIEGDTTQNDGTASDAPSSSSQKQLENTLNPDSEDASHSQQNITSTASNASSEDEVVYTPKSSEASVDSRPGSPMLYAPDFDKELNDAIDVSETGDESELLNSGEGTTKDIENGEEDSTAEKNIREDADNDAASQWSETEIVTDINELKDDPNMLDPKRFTTFATYYFSKVAPPHKNFKLVARPERNRNATYAIMDAARQKGTSQGLEIDECSESKRTVRPVFVYLRSVYDVSETPGTEHVMVMLREMINEWRKENDVPVTIFSSLFEDIEPFVSSSKCTCRSCHSQKDIPNTREIDVRDNLLIEGSYILTLHDTSSARNVAVYEKDGTLTLKESNIRRLVQAIEGRLLKKDFVSLLGEDDRGHQLLNSKTCVLLARYQPDYEELKSYATMLRGRLYKKESLQISDFEEMVQRLVLDHSATCVYALRNSNGSNSIKDNKTVSFENMIANIRLQCRKVEKDLLECVVDPAKIETSYKDVIMDQDTKNNLHRLVNVSKLKFKQDSHRLLQQLKTKGVLFYGPPGTGKTHLSRAIAKNSGANMLAIDGADVTHKWVGDTEKYIKAAFSVARKLHPCVLFMDEVESLLCRRGEGDRSWRRAALTQFLQEIDGLASQKDAPFLICATNRPDDLDQAFLRRLPNKILFAMPTQEEREQIIRLHLDDQDLDRGLTVGSLAKQTKGYSGSDLHNFCQQAAWAWMNEQIDSKVEGITGGNGEIDNKVVIREKADEEQDPDTSKGDDEKANEEHDETTTADLKLTKKHIAKALEMARPSVTTESLRHLESFARRFNPDQVGRLLNGGVASDIGCESIYL